MKRMGKQFLALLLVLTLLASVALPVCAEEETFTYQGQTGQGTDEFMGDPQDVYWVDASVEHPDDYTKIVGFRLTVQYKTHGNYGGGKEDDTFRCGMILATQGAHAPEEYDFTYDNGQTPSFTLSGKTVTSFGVGDAGWLISMVFSKSVSDCADATDGDTLVLEYEGEEAVFTEGDPILTLVSFLGEFEYTDIEWIVGDPVVEEQTEWEPVETIDYLDVPTVDDSVQNGCNYVDIYVPDTGEESYPVLLWIHGGGYITGDRKSCLLSDTREFLLSQGWAFVSVEYTLTGSETVDGTTVYTTAGMPQMLYDIKAAVRFLRANADEYGLNTDFIAAMGESAGAGLALLLGTSNGLAGYEDLSMGNAEYSSAVQAIISVCGPSDFTGDYFGNMMAYLGEEVETTDTDTLEELAEKWSPTKLVNENSPAMLLAYSRADTTVVFSFAEDMEEAALAVMDSRKVVTNYYDNGGHVDRSIFDTNSAYTGYLEFLNTQRAMYLMSGATPEITPAETEAATEAAEEEATETAAAETEAAETETAETEAASEAAEEEDSGGALPVILLIVVAAAVVVLIVLKRRKKA